MLVTFRSCFAGTPECPNDSSQDTWPMAKTPSKQPMTRCLIDNACVWNNVCFSSYSFHSTCEQTLTLWIVNAYAGTTQSWSPFQKPLCRTAPGETSHPPAQIITNRLLQHDWLAAYGQILLPRTDVHVISTRCVFSLGSGERYMAKNAYLHPAASLVSTDSIPCRSVPEGLGSKPATPSFLIRMLLDAIGEVVLGCLEGLPMGVKQI